MSGSSRMDLRVLPLFDAVVKAGFPRTKTSMSRTTLWVDENSDKGDGPMSAETISFEIQVECARRRDGGVGAEGIRARTSRQKRCMDKHSG
jgi:hypothetical protein